MNGNNLNSTNTRERLDNLGNFEMTLFSSNHQSHKNFFTASESHILKQKSSVQTPVPLSDGTCNVTLKELYHQCVDLKFHP